MELHERLRKQGPGETLYAEEDPFAGVKNRIHQYVIAELGPQLYQHDMDPAALRSRVLAVIRNELAEEQGLSRDDRERLTEAICGRHARPRAAREAAGRPDGVRSHGERPARGLDRA